MNENARYQTFLRSLDDQSFISHIQELSQEAAAAAGSVSEDAKVLDSRGSKVVLDNTSAFDGGVLGVTKSFNAQSTPTKLQRSFPSVSTDPFDDGLDEELLKIGDKNDETDADSDSQEVIGKLHSFGDYASYFQNKKLKQQQQDAEYIEWEKKRRLGQKDLLESQGVADKSLQIGDVTPIFKDCAIHVNGHTTPSINEIHRIVILHGGKFVNYLNKKSSATHIVCDKLTPRKMIEFKNCRVVQAKWIVDSVSQDRLLRWQDYRLIQEVDSDQKRLPFGKTESDAKPLAEEADFSDFSDSEQSDTMENELPLLTQPENEDPTLDEPTTIAPTKRKIISDANDPDFLPHFFANSRLHHLSTWKADLRLRFLRRIVKESSQYTSQKRGKSQKVIMHIDFDCFFATASCLNYPKLDIEKQPIAVTHGGRTSDIASCNYVARSFGVKNGMWCKGARQLCPKLIALDYDFDAYERCSSSLYNYLIQLKIFDTIFPVSIDEALLDVSSYVSDHESVNCVEDLCRKIRKEVFELTKCSVSIGVSHNVLLAKLALRKAKPNGFYYLKNDIQDYLRKVRVRELPGVGRSVKQKLLLEMPAGVEEPLIEHLLKYDKYKLMKIFGSKTGAKLYQYSRGEDDTDITIDTSNPESVLGRKSVSVDVNYGIRFNSFEQLENFLMRLAKELHQRMVALGVCGSTVTVRLAKRAAQAPIEPEKHLGMGWCDYVNKSSRFGVPTNDWGVIGSEIKAICRMLNLPPNELRGVSLTMNRLEDVETVRKNRQTRLPFGKVAKGEKITLDAVERMEPESKKPVGMSEDNFRRNVDQLNLGIDWDVFDSLPADIKKEVQTELGRRGLMTKTSPHKGKAYLQQLIPSQLGALPKFVRVIEPVSRSPNKSPTKKQRIDMPQGAAPSPKGPNFNYSDSYDSSVINELPTFVRDEVLRDKEYLDKVKKFDLEPLRDKFNRKNHEKLAEINEITSEWICKEEKLLESPTFLGSPTSYTQICQALENWIEESLKQRGPHQDDIYVFTQYLRALLEQNNLNRCVTLVECIKKCLLVHEVLSRGSSSNDESIAEALADWRKHLHVEIVPVLQEYCNFNMIQLKL